MADAAPKRHMKYPYTFTAKIVQFPWKYYWKHSWLTRYFFYANFITMPIFYKIGKLSHNPANVERWREIDRKTFSGELH
ncbi:uncharacterized protein LOC117172699 [Belonocnema kinseyi]|uniref:uncharacterized protein LOC117172699 n=1 Tax=Belonocnema kinseyi TaxID=2817044 RepID=UPI00143CE703|nr:uncharacterized protein LOC117172699 [Belonocnema kinseyi]